MQNSVYIKFLCWIVRDSSDVCMFNEFVLNATSFGIPEFCDAG